MSSQVVGNGSTDGNNGLILLVWMKKLSLGGFAGGFGFTVSLWVQVLGVEEIRKGVGRGGASEGGQVSSGRPESEVRFGYQPENPRGACTSTEKERNGTRATSGYSPRRHKGGVQI